VAHRSALLLAMALAAACVSDRDDKVSDGTVAGVVLEVRGQATAQAPGQADPRTLAVGSELLAGDRVVTGADSSLRVRLYHNRALLALESGKSLVLRDSAAWSASPGSGGLFERGDHADTTVAGRQAEPEAADTRATGQVPTGEPQAQADRPEPVEPKPTPDDVTKPHQQDTSSRKPNDSKPDKVEPKGTGGGSGSCLDEVACLLTDHPPACCSKYKKGGGGGGGPAESNLPERPGRNDVIAGMAPIKGDLARCASAGGLTAKVSVTVKIEVAPDGSVRGATTRNAPSPEIDACLVAAARKARFARSQLGLTFSYPVVLEPAP